MIEAAPYKDRFAVYEDGVLLAVCSYRKGAVAVRDRLVELQLRIQQLEVVRESMPDLPEGSPCANP